MRGLAGEDCQHAVTDESLCPVTGCTLGTDVCHWMFKTNVNMVQGQEDGPLSKLQYIHPIFTCSDLATHITEATRNTQRAQTSLAEADHYSPHAHCKNIEAWW